MARKPTLEDAFLLGLLEVGEEGLGDIKWWYLMKPKEYQESYDNFIKMRDKFLDEKLIEFNNFSDVYKLTEKGRERAKSIEDEINRDDYISMITRFSPKEELRKRMLNIETLIISLFFGFSSALGLIGLKTITTSLPLYIYLPRLIIFLIIFVIGLTYSVLSLSRIIEFWTYYTAKYGKTRKHLIIYYKQHEAKIKTIYRFVLLPIIALVASIYGLGMNQAIATLILTFIGQLMMPK